ncbi:hypothetical protein Cfor_07306, partial [Coptotermes formosanus]
GITRCTSGNGEMDSTLRKIVAKLQCRVCMQYMTPPIAMCQRGHSICNTCRQKVKQCPTCRQRFSRYRCQLLENIAQKIKYPCKYYKEGCEYVSAAKRIQSHETRCRHRPVTCPFSVVSKNVCWRGHVSGMLDHVSRKHKLLVAEPVLGKCILTLDCVGPCPSYVALSALDATFFVVCTVANMDLYCCILHAGPEEKASCYDYSVTIRKRDGS